MRNVQNDDGPALLTEPSKEVVRSPSDDDLDDEESGTGYSACWGWPICMGEFWIWIYERCNTNDYFSDSDRYNLSNTITAYAGTSEPVRASLDGQGISSS